ncbi:MAG: hypothetical protein KAI47_16155, partial [Deltaproteobacteria bacterium]|nr:hypothetical protein [Deltaproteobacteria bacterium]
GKLTTTRKATLRLKTEKMTALVAAAITGLGTDLILKTMTEIDGMGAHPTTQALNRLMFMETMPAMLAAAQDLPRDRDGDLMIKDHKGSLYSWEIPHPGMSCSANDPCVFYQAFQPIAQAFADHDAEKILVDLMSVVHEHWSSSKSTDYQYKDPKASNYSHGSNAVSYEPAILEIMEKGDLLAALRELSKVVDATKLRDGTALSAQLTKTARFALDPARTPGLAYRDGRTKAMWSDGLTEASGGVTPMYLLVDAWNAVDGALDRVDKHVGDAWREASDHIVDVFMGTQSTPDPKGRPEVRFSNRHVIPTVRVGVDFLSQRILAHSPSCSSSGQCVGGGTCLSNGRCTTRHINDDTAAWAGAKLPADLEDILTGPLPAAAADFVTVLRQDPKADTAVGDILKYLVDELHHDAVFSATLTGLGDMLQLLLDDESLVPLARALGKALGADLGLVDAIMRFAKPAVARDNVGALTRILGNAVKEQSPGESPLEKLFEMSKEMHRQKPGDAAHYTAEDYGQALFEIRDFLGNEGTGLVHFFDIIKTR